MELSSMASDIAILENKLNKEHIREFADRFVSVNKDEFYQKLQKEYITEQMKTVSRFSFRSESLPNLAGSRHYKVTVSRVNQNEFERATDTRVNTINGYGLGLSIVKQLLKTLAGCR